MNDVSSCRRNSKSPRDILRQRSVSYGTKSETTSITSETMLLERCRSMSCQERGTPPTTSKRPLFITEKYQNTIKTLTKSQAPSSPSSKIVKTHSFGCLDKKNLSRDEILEKTGTTQSQDRYDGCIFSCLSNKAAKKSTSNRRKRKPSKRSINVTI